MRVELHMELRILPVVLASDLAGTHLLDSVFLFLNSTSLCSDLTLRQAFADSGFLSLL